ncbi:MAG: hypothetical protein U9R54_05765 [Bacteroidota bacterium]|nr:hypothetical protein [Bacteroidota bacterium]
MKKSLIILIVSLFSIASQAQVFNTGQTLKKGVLSLGVEPVMHINGGANGFVLFAHAGYGLKSGIDVAVKFGLDNPKYFGADLEFALGKRFSVAVGAHNYNNFGLDGTFNFVFPINSDVRIYSGLDADINFWTDSNDELNTNIPFWIPVGLEVGLSSNMNLIFESEIGINNNAYHIIGGGLNFYF